MLLLRTSDQPRMNVIFLSMPNLKAQVKLVKNLGETFLDPEALDDFRGMLKRFGSLSSTRNKYVHCSGGMSGDRQSLKVTLMEADLDDDKGLEFELQEFPLNELKVHHRAVNDLAKEMLLFQDVMRSKVRTWHRTHRESPGGPNY